MPAKDGDTGPEAGQLPNLPGLTPDAFRPGDPGTELGAPPTTLDSDVRGNALLRLLERGFLYLDRLVGRVLPEALNPFLHSGAVAVTSLIVATVTGVVLLIWYRPSAHLAYESVAAMGSAPWTAGLLRSLHRYSSDVCMFFAIVHALRLFLARRFVGARWLAWVTGLATVGSLWFVGWTGYWLVWDERAQHVAVGTARLLDAVPIFADPMGRSFLTDEGINSLLFFVVFFVHMLIPLAMGIFLWLHIVRLARPKFLTSSPMTVWVLGALLLLSVAYPAGSAEPARMAALPQAFTMDWWFLLPLALTDRLGAGALWSVLVLGSAVPLAVPWWLARSRAKPARVTPGRCNACTKCFQDCPYTAISMVPRTDGSTRHDMQAEVDPAKCVGCGICAGSCDTAGVGLDWFAVSDQRWRFAVWLKQAIEKDERRHVAFLCAESAGSSLKVDPETGGCPELPGYLVLQVPCVGWLHPFGVEHTVRFGGKGALVVSCEPGECRYREGAQWEQMRLDGDREPALRTEKVAREKIRLISLNRTRVGDLIREAQRFREGEAPQSESGLTPALTGIAAAVLAAMLAGCVGLVSDLGYAPPRRSGSELVVTFKHPGQIGENCRELSAEEKAALPAHMRRDRICDRARSSVRLRVTVDDGSPVQGLYAPQGIWNDGNSVAVEHIPVPAGEHRVRVEIGDSADPSEWTYSAEQTLAFTEAARRVIVFDRVSGFRFH
jgi:ferredoxin